MVNEEYAKEKIKYCISKIEYFSQHIKDEKDKKRLKHALGNLKAIVK